MDTFTTEGEEDAGVTFSSYQQDVAASFGQLWVVFDAAQLYPWRRRRAACTEYLQNRS